MESGSNGSENKAVNQRNKMFYKTKTKLMERRHVGSFGFFLHQSTNFMNPEHGALKDNDGRWGFKRSDVIIRDKGGRFRGKCSDPHFKAGIWTLNTVYTSWNMVVNTTVDIVFPLWQGQLRCSSLLFNELLRCAVYTCNLRVVLSAVQPFLCHQSRL